MAKYTLVCVRHGESEWNKKNLFCGWHDADLSETGIVEAQNAGKMLKEKGYEFDIAFTSTLKRAIKTLYMVQEELVIWRRSYDTPPPALEPSDPRWSANDRRYSQYDAAVVPACECLKDTVARVLPYWHDIIVPTIKSGQRVLISAHGNSLRALVKYLKNIPDAEIPELNIPTGIPLVIEMDENMKYVKDYYLADEAEVKAAMERVANQGKAK
ncbi:probable phosphoglycerate mutase [Saccostrea cucullata]|uniref:probable phosphoglycerate mutase n=1 Tax=Saccostrea cuccullata TaxID=36930 RepID=UPI002ED25A79